jgi:predicted PurR-regulated permease PerM
MRELLDHPWMRVLIVATTVAMCSFALRETASITLPVISAVFDVAVPVAIGFVIAYVLTPLVDVISRKVGYGRFVATAGLFAVTTLVVAGSLMLVVPILARQSAELAGQVARGETWADRDGNGRYDAGEPFADTNGNGVFDPSMISRVTGWAQERQQSLKRMANLTVEDSGLALLRVYEDETRVARSEIERLLAGGEPAGEAPADAPSAWSPDWPGPGAADIEAAVLRRPHLAGHLNALGRTWAEAHHRIVISIRTLRGGAEDPDLATLTDILRQAAAKQLGPEERVAAVADLRRLEASERAGSAAAAELLTELRGGSGAAVGGQAMALAMEKVEAAVRRTVDTIPDRIGGWAESSLGNLGAIGGLLIDLILVPIYAFFLILAMPAIRSGIKDFIPAKHKDGTLRIVREIERAVSAFFRGRLIICLLCSLVGVAGFLVLQLFGVSVPYGILFGVLLGLATPIPLAGIVIAVPAVALTMIQPGATPIDGVMVFVVYGLVQATEAVLIPVVLGREVEIHPVWLIIALLLCGKLLGVLGVILAVPIAATVRILGREYLWPRLRAWAAKGVEAVQPPRDGPAP